MSAPETDLRRVWFRIVDRDHRGAGAAIDGLIGRYREPHRRYHTAAHIARVLRDVERLLREIDGADPVDDADAVRAAALFHDAVYDPRSAHNEADSADLARRTLGELGWPEQRCDRVASMVEATGMPIAPAGRRSVDRSTAVLLDADLAVLGGDPREYQTYVVGVRAEFAHVDDAAWRDGRAAVLQRLATLEPIYLTDAFRTALERRARANIAAELAGLTANRSD